MHDNALTWWLIITSAKLNLLELNAENKAIKMLASQLVARINIVYELDTS